MISGSDVSIIGFSTWDVISITDYAEPAMWVRRSIVEVLTVAASAV